MSTRRDFIKKAAGAAASVVFTGCNVPGLAHAQGARKQTIINGRRIKTIDIHAHCAIPEAMALPSDVPDVFSTTSLRRSSRYAAKKMANRILANSPGWKLIGPTLTQMRAPPLVKPVTVDKGAPTMPVLVVVDPPLAASPQT